MSEQTPAQHASLQRLADRLEADLVACPLPRADLLEFLRSQVEAVQRAQPPSAEIAAQLIAFSNGAKAYSVFANDAECLQERKAAANALSQVLSDQPASEVQGPVRTARIKCDLAARHSQTHRQVDDRFCEVSELLYRGGVRL